MDKDPTIEIAQAVKEVAVSAGKAIDATREAGSFISKYIGGSLEQAIGIVEDRLRYARWERTLRLLKRAETLKAELDLPPATATVPLKLVIPLLQAASMEEDDGLQDRWANLLVNAANANSPIKIERAYISVLEVLSSLEVQILDTVYGLAFESGNIEVLAGQLPSSARLRTKVDTDEEVKLLSVSMSDEVKLALSNLSRLGCIKLDPSWGGDFFHSLNPTIFGSSFVNACRLQRT